MRADPCLKSMARLYKVLVRGPIGDHVMRNGNRRDLPPARRGPMMSTPVVLITGALTGIGRATALAFAQEGTRIVISGRRDESGQALATELRALGAEAEYVRADVRH